MEEKKVNKDQWRLRFKLAAFALVVSVLIAGTVLFVLGKGDGFAAFVAGIVAFASTVFVADYATKPGENK